jgi:hypothetical protein
MAEGSYTWQPLKFEGLFDASRTVMSRGDGLGFAMPRHLGSVSSGSAIPGIVVLRKTLDDVSEFVKQYSNLRFRRVSVVTTNRQYMVTAGPRENSPWFQLHEKRSTVEEWPVGVQLDDRVPARILHRSRRPWMFEELLTFKVPPAINAGRPSCWMRRSSLCPRNPLSSVYRGSFTR